MTETLDGADGYAVLPVRIGCAGWGLSSRVAETFASDGSHLERYARVFSSVEINSSFYRPHQPKTYARWAASVPDAFRFAVKIPRAVTHERKLCDTDAVLGPFLEQIDSLGDKLGCLLLQLPPSLAFDASQAQAFFSMLGERTRTLVVCEPRHVSWFTPSAAGIMRSAGIGCVRAHPLPVPDIEPAGDPRSLYIRLHGAPKIYYSAYDDAFIEALAERIVAARRLDMHVWCIFDNTALGEAVPNALSLIERLTAMAR